MRHLILLLLFIFISPACKNLDTINENNPSLSDVLTTGDDLLAVLQGGYVSWWQGVHGPHPVIGLSIAADTYTMSWGNFGAQRMGEEPRTFYNNRSSEETDYKQLITIPWQGCLSAVSSANEVLQALENGVTIDNDGPQDQMIRASAHLLRGLSWGYLGLLFDQALLVDETTEFNENMPLTPYKEMIAPAVAELERAAEIATPLELNFVHSFFNGLSLDVTQFVQLCHSYAARFLSQWPRTPDENIEVNWQAVLTHSEKGLTYNFAPIADGNFWQSYQQYVFAETGLEPFWARVDQRLVAALDPTQPARYPEVNALGETPLANPEATSADKRLETDFTFFEMQNFPVDRGEWHFSHYKHNRNSTDPSFAGNGTSTGPMPVFTSSDNLLLLAEALLRLNRLSEAVELINTDSRVLRGELPLLSAASPIEVIEMALQYERAIELLGTAPMGQWFDRRRLAPRESYDAMTPLGGLQMGTPAQLPVPADELRVQGVEPYNFGGPEDPEGIVPIF